MVCFSMDFETTRYDDKIYCVFYGFSFTVMLINVVVFCVMTSCCNLVDGWDVLPPSLSEALSSIDTWELLANVQHDASTLNITKCTARCLNPEYHKMYSTIPQPRISQNVQHDNSTQNITTCTARYLTQPRI
jgi:hypothetical protein